MFGAASAPLITWYPPSSIVTQLKAEAGRAMTLSASAAPASLLQEVRLLFLSTLTPIMLKYVTATENGHVLLLPFIWLYLK